MRRDLDMPGESGHSQGMKKLKLLSLFAGIGGIELGLERSGYFETVAQCEKSAFRRRVLAKNWPGVTQYDDITRLDAARLAADGIIPDAVSAGFPCQDISSAGKQAGIGEGTRSGLYRPAIDLIAALRPKVAIFENVSRLLSGPKEAPGEWMWQFLWDLAQSGFDAEWQCITAGSLGAPHERDRVFVVAYPNTSQLERGGISRRIHEEHAHARNPCWGQDKPGVVRTLDGLPHQMDRVAALGDAVVPAVAEVIGRAIGRAFAAIPARNQERNAA